MTESLTLNFSNLPLVEAAVRATLAPPLKLTFSAINEIHGQLRDQFPEISEPTTLDVAPGAGPQTIEMGTGQIPGVLLTGRSDGVTVTLQPHVVVARWARKRLGTGPDYPRFAALREALWAVADKSISATGAASSHVLVVNMSYVNFIPSDADTILTDYFSGLAHVKVTDGAKQVRKLETSWQEKNNIDLRFAIEQVTIRPPGEEEQHGFRLTTAAGLRLPDTDNDPKSALDGIHDRLQHFFISLISDRAKKEWQLGTS